MARVDPAPGLAAALAPLELPEADGDTVRLGDMWERRLTLLVHLRHFG